jgi:hypothetical protein
MVKPKHGFSVEIKSKEHVNTLKLSRIDREGVLFEGYLGEIEEMGMLEEAVLFIKGEYGTIRIDLTEDEIKRFKKKPKTS